ncbi:MAG TPA: diguanylate cyclase [Spirochaetota bacterium]|nr:diguanylate cyclase [Spirochaetota bacterium]HQH99108.1 diguanylate cyclase [Spirochaetota bacterium]HQJ72781.1 diguanylate cyclase [Spirochaetota bacterium]
MGHTFTLQLSIAASLVIISLASVYAGGRDAGSPVELKSLKEQFSLAGQWRIMLGDDARYADPGYDDSSWDTVAMPGSLMPYILPRTGSISGILWLRKTVYIDRDLPREDLGLIMGRISNADETYFNGTRVGGMGEFPPEAHSMWNHPRYYPVNRPFIQYGADNVIAVRLSYYLFSEILGEIAVSDMKHWNKDKDLGRFLFIDLSYIVLAIGFALLVVYSFIFMLKPTSQEYLFYCLQLLCGFFMMLEVCTYWNFYGSMMARFKVLGVAWAAVNVTHPIFLHRIYDLKRKRIEALLWIYLAVIVFIALLFIDDSNIRLGAISMILVTQLIGFYNLSCHVTALVKRHPYALMFSFFGIILVLGAIHDGWAYLLKLYVLDAREISGFFQVMVLPYAAAGLYVGTALILAVRFVRMMKEVEDLNVNLEKKVDERTFQLKVLTHELEDKNRILSEVALRDSLTGLYNHAAFHARLQELINESKRHRFSICVVMIDIDDFKVFNDNYGHQLGDEILLRISDIFKSGLREYDAKSKFLEESVGVSTQIVRNYDLVGRYGGDEFVLLLPHCGEDEAKVVAERMCRSIEAIRLKSYPDLKITGSFGIAMLDEHTECRDSKELIALADKALYRAKSEGKNRICYIRYQ